MPVLIPACLVHSFFRYDIPGGSGRCRLPLRHQERLIYVGKTKTGTTTIIPKLQVISNELHLEYIRCNQSDLAEAAREKRTWTGLFHCHDQSGLQHNMMVDAVLPGAAKIATVQEPFHHAVSTWFQWPHGSLDDHLLAWCKVGGVQVSALMRKPGQTTQDVVDEYDALMPTPYLESALAYAIAGKGRCWPPEHLYVEHAANQNSHRSSSFTYESIPQWHNATLRSHVASACAEDVVLFQQANLSFHGKRERVQMALARAWETFTAEV